MSRTNPALILAFAVGLASSSTIVAASGSEPVEVSGQVTLAADSFIEIWTTNDPRLTGEGRWDQQEGYPRDRAPSYFLNGRLLETEDGTWRQLPVPTVNLPDKADRAVWDLVLIGEDGYDGLAFVAQATWDDPSCPPGCDGFEVHGYIVEAAGS